MVSDDETAADSDRARSSSHGSGFDDDESSDDDDHGNSGRTDTGAKSGGGGSRNADDYGSSSRDGGANAGGKSPTTPPPGTPQSPPPDVTRTLGQSGPKGRKRKLLSRQVFSLTPLPLHCGCSPGLIMLQRTPYPGILHARGRMSSTRFNRHHGVLARAERATITHISYLAALSLLVSVDYARPLHSFFFGALSSSTAMELFAALCTASSAALYLLLHLSNWLRPLHSFLCRALSSTTTIELVAAFAQLFLAAFLSLLTIMEVSRVPISPFARTLLGKSHGASSRTPIL